MGDPCNVTSECSPAVGNSTCSNVTNTCSCLMEFYSSHNNTECTLRQIRDSCNVTEQCSKAVGNSECNSGSCACTDGFKTTSNLDTCILLTVGDNCNKTVQCESAVNNSVCNSTGSCECLVGYASHNKNTECLLNQITSPCLIDTECSTAVSNSSCINATCGCESGFYSSDQNQTCTLRMIGDSNCRTRDDCSSAVGNSECNNGEFRGDLCACLNVACGRGFVHGLLLRLICLLLPAIIKHCNCVCVENGVYCCESYSKAVDFYSLGSVLCTCIHFPSYSRVFPMHLESIIQYELSVDWSVLLAVLCK